MNDNNIPYLGGEYLNIWSRKAILLGKVNLDRLALMKTITVDVHWLHVGFVPLKENWLSTMTAPFLFEEPR